PSLQHDVGMGSIGPLSEPKVSWKDECRQAVADVPGGFMEPGKFAVTGAGLCQVFTPAAFAEEPPEYFGARCSAARNATTYLGVQGMFEQVLVLRRVRERDRICHNEKPVLAVGRLSRSNEEDISAGLLDNDFASATIEM